VEASVRKAVFIDETCATKARLLAMDGLPINSKTSKAVQTEKVCTQ
jgi:hypothetical protein